MHRRVLAALVAVLVASLLPAGVALAADVQPIVTLDPIAATVYRGDLQAFVAHTNSPVGVFFERSYDGTTWETFTGSSQGGGDNWHSSTFVPDIEPLGPRYVRAHVNSSPGFLEANSDPQPQTVAIHSAEIQGFSIVSLGWADILPGSPVRIEANGVRGAVKFDRKIGDSWEVLGGNDAPGASWVDLDPLGVGSHTFRARIEDSATATGVIEEKTVDIQKSTSIPQWQTPLAVQAHHSLYALVSVGAQPNNAMPYTGTTTVTNVATGAIVASGEWAVEFTLPPMTLGGHAFKVDYSGDVNFSAASKTFTVTVTPDTVQATNVKLDHTTFYPIVDGYHDTVRAVGTRQETASVRVSIYNSANKIVRALTVASGTGAYGVSWNGKTSSGALVAAGKYRVVQVLTDAFGTHKTITSYVNLSWKRLHTSSTVLNLSGPTKKTSSWAAWNFVLPSATVYKSLKLQVYGRSTTIPGVSIGAHDVRRCTLTSTYNPNCASSWTAIGYSVNWYSKTLSPTYNRSGRTVRAFAYAFGAGGVSKARLYVTYQVLR